MQRKINNTVIWLWIGKNLTAKTPPGDFQVTILETQLLSQQAVTSKGISSTLPTYSWTLTPIPNWTCSIVTVPLFNAWLLSTWLTNCADLSTRLQSPTKKVVGCKILHPHDEDQEDAWSQNPKMHIYSNFFKRKRWTRVRTSSPVTICLNRVYSMLVQLVYHFTALKTILLYV